MAPPDDDPSEGLRPMAASGRATTSDGVGVAYYDFGGSGPALLLVHATGFCAATLAPVAERLRHRFRCVALDERGHGASDRPPGGDYAWHGFAADVLAVVDTLGLERPFGLGHSCGGAALLLAEEARPGTFAGLFCFEPIVFPGDEVPGDDDANPLAQGARRRRPTFSSRAEALANFAGKPPFDRLDPEALAAYVDNGFAPTADGGITLRCRREDEARIYALSFAHHAFTRFDAVRCPVALACGEDTDAFGPPLLGRLAARLASASTSVLGAMGHFGPLEDPGAVAAWVLRAQVPEAVTPEA